MSNTLSQTKFNAVKRFFRIVDIMNLLIKLIGGIILCSMTIIVFAAVISRYVANISLTWVEESATFGMAWICSLGAGLATRLGDMTTVELGIMRLPFKAKRNVRILACLLSLAFFTFVIIGGYQMALVAGVQRMTTIPQLTMFWVYISMPVGMVVMIINTIARIIEIWMEGRN